jgi:hypothetical protein
MRRRLVLLTLLGLALATAAPSAHAQSSPPIITSPDGHIPTAPIPVVPGSTAPSSPLPVGAEVALFHPDHKRYMRIDGNAKFVVNGPGQGTAASALPASWKWERFRVIDAGNGRVALYNHEFKRFVRLSSTYDVDSTASADPYGLPATWNQERFEVKVQPDGRVALYQAHLGRYVSMKSDHDFEGATTPMGFDVGVLTAPSLVPGSVVALFHQTEKCFVRIHGTTGRADCGGHKGTPAELPADWTWERFHVVDGGAGRVALYNATTKSFLRMTSGSPPAGVEASEIDSSERATAELPATWGWERFTVEERGLGVVALSNHAPKRYLSLPGAGPTFDLAAATTPGLYLVHVLVAAPPLQTTPTTTPTSPTPTVVVGENDGK